MLTRRLVVIPMRRRLQVPLVPVQWRRRRALPASPRRLSPLSLPSCISLNCQWPLLRPLSLQRRQRWVLVLLQQILRINRI